MKFLGIFIGLLVFSSSMLFAATAKKPITFYTPCVGPNNVESTTLVDSNADGSWDIAVHTDCFGNVTYKPTFDPFGIEESGTAWGDVTSGSIDDFEADFEVDVYKDSAKTQKFAEVSYSASQDIITIIPYPNINPKIMQGIPVPYSSYSPAGSSPFGDVKIYPVPADEIVKIEVTDVPQGMYSVEITDISGANVSKKQSMEIGGDRIIEVPIVTLSPGVYYINISNGNQTGIIQKFIIE